jgi:hypothetical protein
LFALFAALLDKNGTLCEVPRLTRDISSLRTVVSPLCTRRNVNAASFPAKEKHISESKSFIYQLMRNRVALKEY